MINNHSDHCIFCGKLCLKGEGFLTGAKGNWKVRCLDKQSCRPPASEVKTVFKDDKDELTGEAKILFNELMGIT